jgi:putative peptidoglycan lipid II flippase
LSSNNKKITGAAIIVMTSLVVSRITGYVRTILINNLLTASQSDSLLAAFRTTDLMYNLLIGGAISAALVPVLSGYLAKDEEEDGWKAIGTFVNVVFLTMIGVCILGVIFAPAVVSMTASGLHGEKRELTIQLTRILFPSVGFMMLAGITNGVLYSYKRFASAAFAPSVYNLGTALSIFVLSRYGVRYVAFGVLTSAIVYFVMQISFAWKNLRYYRPRILWKNTGFRRLFKLAIPSLAASAVAQINILISLNFISLFKNDGSITAYYNANDLWQLPYGIFAMGLGTAILPTLSEKLALKQVGEFKDILIKGFKTILYLIIPSAVAFMVLSQPVVSVVYKWSQNIGRERIVTAGSILLLFTAAMIAQSMLALLNRAFYADNDTKTPLYIGTVSIALNFVFCYIFLYTTDLGPAGMSLSYSIQSVVNMAIMMIIISRRMNGMEWKKLLNYSLKLLGAALIMGILLFGINRLVPVNFTAAFTMHSKLMEIAALGVEIVVGAFVYFGFTMLFKIDEAVAVRNKFFGKLKRMLKKS